MQDSKHQQRTHGIVENHTIGAVQFCNGGEREAEGHVFEEVAMRAGVDVEVGVSLSLVAEILFFLDAVVDHAIGKEDQVGGEWQRPGSSDCCYIVSEGPSLPRFRRGCLEGLT